jgi:hypothetical protein
MFMFSADRRGNVRKQRIQQFRIRFAAALTLLPITMTLARTAATGHTSFS